MSYRKFATLIVAGILLGAGGANAAESALPGAIDESGSGVPPHNTYADQHRDALQRIPGAPGVVDPAYGGSAEEGVVDVPPKSTYADEHRGAGNDVRPTRTRSPKLYTKD